MFGDQPPKAILFCYGIWQETYSLMESEIQGLTFYQGLPSESELMEFTDPKVHTAVVLDDLQHTASNSQVVELLFTRLSHHKHCSCFYLLQNAYIQGKNQRTISLNAKYIEIFRSPRSLMQLQYLNSQIFPDSKNILIQAYKDVMSQHPFSYLVIDLTAHCPDELRIRTAVFPEEETIIYSAH